MEALAIQLAFILIFLVALLGIVIAKQHNSGTNIIVRPPEKFLKVGLPRKFSQYKITKVEVTYEYNGETKKVDIPVK